MSYYFGMKNGGVRWFIGAVIVLGVGAYFLKEPDEKELGSDRYRVCVADEECGFAETDCCGGFGRPINLKFMDHFPPSHAGAECDGVKCSGVKPASKCVNGLCKMVSQSR